MLLVLVSILLQVLSLSFILYKSMNLIHLTQSGKCSVEQYGYVVNSWVLFLVLSTIKCSCSSTIGLVWNIVVQVALAFCLLNAKSVQLKLFDEKTYNSFVEFGRGLVEKYVPKYKTE